MRTAIFACALACAASISAETWSLQECIDYAISQNIDVRQRMLSQYEGELSVTEAKDRFLPSVSAYAGQNFNFGRALTADNTYANRNTSSFSAGALLNLPIFQGLAGVRRLDYSRTALKALLEQTESAKDDVTLNVIAQYLQALYASENVAIARERTAISRRELERRQILLEAGRIPELDIFEAQSLLSSDELSLVQAENDSVIALLDLSQLLNLPHDADFHIAPVDEQMMPLTAPDDVFANALAHNHALKAGRWQVEAADKSVALAKSGYIPTLSFSAGIGTNYYRTTGFNNDSFGEQMRHNFAKSIGFSLSIPLFDAFSTRNSVRRAKVQLQSSRLQYEDSYNRLYKAIVQAYTQAVSAEKKSILQQPHPKMPAKHSKQSK